MTDSQAIIKRRPTLPIRAVAFDLDGLMFDTEALFVRVAGSMLERRGKVFTPDIMARMIGRQWAVAGVAFKEMAGLSESLDELLAEARGLFLARMDDEVQPMPGVIALLDHLERLGLPRAVCTSSRRAYAERLLGHHGLAHHFSFLLTADDVTNSKPDPEIYLSAALRFGIEPEYLLVLEDSAAGIEAAKAAGAFAVGVPHDQSPAEGLAAADRLIDRLDSPDLLALLPVPPAGPDRPSSG